MVHSVNVFLGGLGVISLKCDHQGEYCSVSLFLRDLSVGIQTHEVTSCPSKRWVFYSKIFLDKGS